MTITRRQSEVLDFVKEFIGANGFSPTYEEIGAALGVSSVATIHKHVQCLKAAGRITFEKNIKQSIQVISEPASPSRFKFEGPHHLWDNVLGCYWVKEVDKGKRK